MSDRPLRPATSGRELDAAGIASLCGTAIENAARFRGLRGLTTFAAPQARHLVFLDTVSPERLAAIAAAPEGTLFLLPEDARGQVDQAALFVSHVREAFAKLAEALFDYSGGYWEGYEAAQGAAARRAGVRVMPGSTIHRDAVIGAGTFVAPGVAIGPNVEIGRDCLILANAAIGFAGFGVFVGSDGRNRHLPHVGGVVIGDEVEIGALNTVCAGTIHPTVVEDTVKTDAHVHIAHNCWVRRGAKLTAHAELSGSVEVGEDAWLGPNCSVIESRRIGAGALVGIAANVVKDVPDGAVVAGNPARILRKAEAD
jgi:UDP-3-O-[3-hydroxymyristoyl] glucosamine N-acyltransferase